MTMLFRNALSRCERCHRRFDGPEGFLTRANSAGIERPVSGPYCPECFDALAGNDKDDKPLEAGP